MQVGLKPALQTLGLGAGSVVVLRKPARPPPASAVRAVLEVEIAVGTATPEAQRKYEQRRQQARKWVSGRCRGPGAGYITSHASAALHARRAIWTWRSCSSQGEPADTAMQQGRRAAAATAATGAAAAVATMRRTMLPSALYPAPAVPPCLLPCRPRTVPQALGTQRCNPWSRMARWAGLSGSGAQRAQQGASRRQALCGGCRCSVGVAFQCSPCRSHVQWLRLPCML